MYCPFCQAEDTKVVDSRIFADGSQIRRRRKCDVCNARFTTFEVADLALPKIIKNDGKRQEFNGSKLKKGMLRALEKRPLSAEKTDALFSKILSNIRVLGRQFTCLDCVIISIKITMREKTIQFLDWMVDFIE